MIVRDDIVTGRKGLINNVSAPHVSFGDAVMFTESGANHGVCVTVDHMDPRAEGLVIGVFDDGKSVNVVRVGTLAAEMTMWMHFGLACRVLSGEPR